jgi:hypothetical protein
MSEPCKITQLLDNAVLDSVGIISPAGTNHQMQIEGEFGGATVKLFGRLTSSLTMIQLHFEDGSLAEWTEPIADALPRGLARFSEIQLQVVGGDGTTAVNAFIAETLG